MDSESHFETLAGSNLMSSVEPALENREDLHGDKRDSLEVSMLRMNRMEDDSDDLGSRVIQSGMDKIRSRRVDYKEKDSLFYAVRYLFECGYKLKCNPETIAAASALLHRFFKECENSSYDKYLVAATTLYIVGKLYDEKYKIRDVINVSHITLNRGSSPLDLSDEYWMRRDAIVQAELLLMRMFSFNVTYDHPHKYMLHYLLTLKTWIPKSTWEAVPLTQASFAFLQDIHHDSTVITHQPQHLALACIHLALMVYGVEIPYFSDAENKTWYSIFCSDLKEEKLVALIDSIIDVYNMEPSNNALD